MEKQFIDSIRPFILKFAMDIEYPLINELNVLDENENSKDSIPGYYLSLKQILQNELNVLYKDEREMKLLYIESLYRKAFGVIIKHMSAGFDETKK